MAAFIVMVIRGHQVPKFFKCSIFLIAILSLTLDLVSVYYPKPGHAAGFIVGLCLSLIMVPKKQNA